jgi:8-oxo-dGTP pyrophosphatase MutT (NUDIX family)
VAFRGPLFRVEVLRWADGRRRDVVRHPGACAAVTFVAGTDDVLLVRQLREAVGRPLLEVVAGVYDVAGESPEDAVRREIAEETGHRTVGEPIPLGRVLTTPGFADEAIDLFEAAAEPGAGEPEAGIEVVPVGFAEAVRMAVAGEIEDAKSALALLLANERRRRAGLG